MGKQYCVVPESDIVDPKLLVLAPFGGAVVGVSFHVEEKVESDQCEVAYSFGLVTGGCCAFVEDERRDREWDDKFWL